MKETWNVLDPDEYVKHNPFMGYTNMKIEKISPECSEISMKITHGVTNLMGMVHGGMLYALADVVTGLTANHIVNTEVFDSKRCEDYTRSVKLHAHNQEHAKIDRKSVV